MFWSFGAQIIPPIPLSFYIFLKTIGGTFYDFLIQAPGGGGSNPKGPILTAFPKPAGQI